jgi:hypothetical protein
VLASFGTTMRVDEHGTTLAESLHAHESLRAHESRREVRQTMETVEEFAPEAGDPGRRVKSDGVAVRPH